MIKKSKTAIDIKVRMIKLGVTQQQMTEMLKADGYIVSRPKLSRAILYAMFEPEVKLRETIIKKLDELEGEARGSRRVSRDNRKDS